MKFSDIPGQNQVKQRLRELVDSGKIPHALLLEGPEGTAKYALARAYAQYLHCTNRTPDGDSCGVCPSCRQHESFNQIDTFFSFPIIKRSSTKPAISDDYIGEFRSFMTEYPFMPFSEWLEVLDHPATQPQIYVDEGSELIRKLNYKARSADRKVVLLWLPERMVNQTANKLLKLIEEPHSDTVFVMTSSRPNEILPTIYSRAQRIPVKRFSNDEIVEYLEQKGVSEDDARDIARQSEGNINRALQILSMGNESSKMLMEFAELMRRGFKRDLPALRKWANDMGSKTRERQIAFIDYCAYLFHENMLLNIAAEKNITVLSPEEAQFSSRFHPYVNSRNVIGLFNVMNDAKRDISANGNGKIVFFDVAVKILMLIRK